MARKASFVKGSPLETFNRNFYILTLLAVKSSYIAASLLKDNEILSNEMIKDLEQVESNILNKLSVNIDGPFLRNRFFVKAGSAPKDPFIVSSSSKEASNMLIIARKGENYANTLPFVLDYTRNYKLEDLLDLALKALEDRNIALSDTLKQAMAPNGLRQYYDIMQVKVRFEPLAEYSDTNHYKMIIDFIISSKVYSKIILSDEIEQNTYLLSIWLHNCLQASSTRGRQIVDPRRVSSNTRKLSIEYGEAKARVNKEGYALFRTGLPIFIGNGRIDYISKLMEAGKSAISEDGFFSPRAFSEDTSLTNKIIYVDWYNDLLVYTSATGLIQTLSLRGTSKLSDIDEWMFLSMPIIEPKLNVTNRVINAVLADISFEEMKSEYIAMGGAEKDLDSDTFRTFSNVYGFIVSNTGRSAPNVTWGHIAGYDRENLKLDAASRSSYSVAYRMLTAIVVAQAYFKAFRKAGKTPSSSSLPVTLQALGIRVFLEGVYYILNAMAIKSTADINAMIKSYEEEKAKWEVSTGLTSIKIPNVKVGGKGFNGLLPHQAEIASSLIKNPRYNVLSISTGGGKCLEENHLVLTDKGLIKVGELNRMSGNADAEGFSPFKEDIRVLTRHGLKKADRSYHTKGQTVKAHFSDGDFIEGLPEHRLLTLTGNNTLEYVRLDNLNGKYIPRQSNSNIFPSEKFKISWKDNKAKKGHEQDLAATKGKKLPVKVGVKLATLLGLVYPSGSMNDSSDALSYADEGVTDLYRKLVKKLFKCDELEARKTYLNRIIDDCPVEIPLCIRMSPEKVQAAFLRALFEGNGSIYLNDNNDSNWSVAYKSGSLLLVRQVKAMLANFGIFSSIEVLDTSSSFELKISNKFLSVFCKKISFLSEEKKKAASEWVNASWYLKVLGPHTNTPSYRAFDSILPIGSLVIDTVYLIESLVKGIPGEDDIKSFWEDPHFLSSGEETSTLVVNALFNRLSKAPDEIKKVLKNSESLRDKLSLIRDLSSREWVKVTSVEEGSFKDVYDISVPKFEEYVVDSMMSHNTTIGYINAASAIMVDPKTRPLITTKGNLIHNTVTEINTITGGQFNAVPFTPSVIRRLKTQAGLKGIKDLMKWVKELPPNTVLINSYSNFGSRSILFPEMPQDESFADIEIGMSQYNKILRLCNISMIIGDESHLIKNVSSKRTRGAYGAFAAADTRTIMSGTLISNTVKDLVGQINSVTPNIFGDNLERFCEDYNISQTGILSDEDASLIKKKITSSVSWQQKTPDSWGYMLPDVDDEITFVKLTPKQETFYNKVLTEAIIEIQNKEESKIPASENEDEEEDNDEEADENSDDAFVARISKSLMPLEEFLVAPDFNELYVNQVGSDRPSGSDLISPKVMAVDQLIRKHFETSKNEANSNKLIVAGWSLNGIRHLQKHSTYADEAVTYFAGDSDAIRKFKDDPTVRIMFAAETSIREGENLQATACILRLQSVWTPGDHNQLRARMYRPDPRGIYNRDSVKHIWILTERINSNPTLDGLKLARLSSKTVNNARVVYDGRMEWKTVSSSFDELSTFKMNIDTFIKTVGSDVAPYFDAWKTYNKWEMGLNRQQRFKKASQLEASTGLDLIDSETSRIKDVSQFINLAMVKVEPVIIPNSRKVYTPWVPRVLPPDPDDYWGWSTVGSSPLKEGDVVMTEYGPGIVEWVKEGNCRVNCYGGRFYILPRTLIVKPNPKRQLELNSFVRDPLKWHSMSLDVVPLKAPTKPKNNEKPQTPPLSIKESIIATPKPQSAIPEKKEEQEEEEKVTLDVVPLIINGFPAVVVRDDVPALKKLPGWNRVDPYLSIQFKTWTAVDKFLDQLNEKFYIEQKLLDTLDTEIELLRSGKTLTQIRRVNPADLRNFIIDQKRPLGFKTLKSGRKEAIVKPYFITVDRKVRLAFDINSHDPSIIRFIRGLRGDPRVQQIIEVKTPIWFNVFNSISEAKKDISNLSTIADFDKAQISLDLADIAREIKELGAPRRNPNI